MSQLWSTRAPVICRANLRLGEPYRVREGLVYPSKRQDLGGGLSGYVLDAQHEAETVSDALVRGIDIIDQFLDAIAIVSYGSARRTDAAVSRPPRLAVGQSSELATLRAHMIISSADVEPDDIKAFTEQVVENSRTAAGARYLREALTATSPSDAHWGCWAALETIAWDESDELRSTRCSHCGEVETTRERATMPKVREFFVDAGSSGQEATRQRQMRAKIVHGGSLKNVDAQSDAAKQVAKIEPVAMRTVATRTGLPLRTPRSIVHGLPIVVWNIHRSSSEQVDWTPASFEVSAAFVEVQSDEPVTKHRNIEIGLQIRPDPQTVELGLRDSEWPQTEV